MFVGFFDNSRTTTGVRVKKFLKIGLTGGIGSGKSTVLKLLAKKGVPVLQTDFIGHELLKKKSIKKKLIQRFGREILGPGGGINRQKLAKAVFSDALSQRWLNELLHPVIRKTVSRWIIRQQKGSCSLAVVEVPLLFERGYNRSFDGVLSVSAPRAVRRKRLLNRGWDLREIQRREKSQWTPGQKDKKADWVIFNRRGLKALRYAVSRWLQKIENPVKDGR